jgi:RND family efflux transporter MFP subunit
VLVVGALGGCDTPTPKASVKSESTTEPMQVVSVELHDAPQTIKVQGSLLNDEQAVVGVKVAGRVSAVYVDLGATVKRGEKLAVIDPAEFQIKIRQSQAEVASVRARLGLKNGQPADQLDPNKTPIVIEEKALLDGAEGNYRRAAAAARNRGIGAEELEVKETAYKVAEARYSSALHQVDEQIALLDKHANTLKLAEQALADATITAPFDGMVAVRQVAPGAYLQVGDPVVTLVRTDPLRFHAGVPERHALMLRVGQEAVITVEGHASPLTGKISRLSPTLNLANRALPIEVDVPNPNLRLRAGLFAEAEIVVNPQARVLTVPRSALVEFAGVEKVCVVKDGQAVMRKVVTGRKLGNLVEITEGLTATDQVAVDGQRARPGRVAISRATP